MSTLNRYPRMSGPAQPLVDIGQQRRNVRRRVIYTEFENGAQGRLLLFIGRRTPSIYYRDMSLRHKPGPKAVSAVYPFPFTSLPVELSLKIITLAVTCGQETYRSLLLTNKHIYALTHLEMLPHVAITLTDMKGLEAFDYFLTQRGGEVIPFIHNLWIIHGGTSVTRTGDLCMSIIQRCSDIRTLACHPIDLMRAMPGPDAENTRTHPHCVSLTLFQFRIRWGSYMTPDQPFCQFMDQIQQLHFIGALDHQLDSEDGAIPELANVRRASIALGSGRIINSELFMDLLASPKLERVVLTSHLHQEQFAELAMQAPMVDHRLSVVHRRRRWKEQLLWQQRIHDPERFWEQAEAEKQLNASDPSLA
uniref:F-box domain-containing protein n=1 Tax=Mycena chlorophos TaxID=658473 RepID=A0ABQ0LJA8_MYCCL|nr:predicted protein [Mycena chlorophos]